MLPAPGGTGNFIAWDARVGKIVWSNPERFSAWGGGALATPSGIISNINTYKHEGKQYISILSGIDGWAGIGIAIPSLENSSDGLGAVGAYSALSSWTNLGGISRILLIG